MLALLKIRNLALVDELVWEPRPGFLGITGETGAGKSVIMGGLALVLGERADKSMIRSGESQCSLEAVFHLPRTEEIDRQLDAAGVAICEDGELLIRRTITATANRQFINNTPVTLHLLRQVASGLVDMHRPDAHRSLALQERQLELLDAYAEDEPQKAAYQAAYRDWQEARRAYRELLESERANARELDFLRHQVDEIESAAFSAEEVAGLEARWQRARNASRLRDTVLPMTGLVEGEEDSLLSRLRQLVRSVHELARLDEACAAWRPPLETCIDELSELSGEMERYLGHLEADPAELAELETRIGLLDTLKRKYGADYETIMAHGEACRAKLDAMEHREERLQELEAREKACHTHLLEVARGLSEARHRAAPRLAADFLTHARHLGFRQSLFTVQLTPCETPSPHGMEEADFLFGPNPGEPQKPLRLIASSGEMARVMLALKSALARQDDTPLLVFDEIDANVGGEIARAVGLTMRELGREHQVIAITHFPQVAALADHHYLISKNVQEGRTVSRMREVAGDERVAELVRMLGSGGARAEAHARELLAASPRP